MDDVITNKLAIIERCIIRIKEEYYKDIIDFDNDYARQDSVVLNIERAVQATIDIGTRIIRLKKLGIPQSARDVFNTLFEAKLITKESCRTLQNMVGFRNIAVHDYQSLNLEVVRSIVENNLVDFENFKASILKQSIEREQ